MPFVLRSLVLAVFLAFSVLSGHIIHHVLLETHTRKWFIQKARMFSDVVWIFFATSQNTTKPTAAVGMFGRWWNISHVGFSRDWWRFLKSSLRTETFGRLLCDKIPIFKLQTSRKPLQHPLFQCSSLSRFKIFSPDYVLRPFSGL